MYVLLEEIRRTDATAASELERAKFCTDSEIQSLTREDLHELLPGVEKLKLRRTLYGIIHKQKPINVLLKELKDFIPHDSFRAALNNNGVLVDYLHILKDMNTQVNTVQTFLDAHIGLLEDISKTQPDWQPDKGPSTSATCDPAKPLNGQPEGYPQGAHGSLPGVGFTSTSGQMMPRKSQTGRRPQGSQSDLVTLPSQDRSEGALLSLATVTYQMVVSGKTFNAHVQLMDKVQAYFQDRVQLIECSQDCQVIIVFCPISSRTGADINAAMSNVTGDKPVILVLMHHAHEVKHVTPKRTWQEYSNVVLHVNVFYHDTAYGLLRCQENNDAADQIKKKLLEYKIPRSEYSGDNTQAVIAQSSRTGSIGGGGGNSRGSHTDWWQRTFPWSR